MAGWKARSGGFTLSRREAYIDLPMQVRCGRCAGCLLDRGKEWAARCVHEAQLHDLNSFVTLTYDNEHLPRGGTLVPEHPQLFMKRLRRARPGIRVSYFLCGEYGERSERPHYHALLFGCAFPDQVLIPRSSGEPLYRSEELARLWGLGFCSIGAVTFQSAAYCARYVLKKFERGSVLKPSCTADGELIEREAEFLRVSLRPGIGRGWVERFESDVYPDDFVVVDGRKHKVPRYYDKLHQRGDEDAARRVKLDRIERMSTVSVKQNSTAERLRVREEVAVAAVHSQGRPL